MAKGKGLTVWIEVAKICHPSFRKTKPWTSNLVTLMYQPLRLSWNWMSKTLQTQGHLINLNPKKWWLMSKFQAIFSISYQPQTFSILCSKVASNSNIRWYLKSLALGTNWTQSSPILLVWTSRVYLVIKPWWRSQRPRPRQLCLKNEQWEAKTRESIIYSVNLEWTWRWLTIKQLWHRKDLGSMGQLKVVLTYARL